MTPTEITERVRDALLNHPDVLTLYSATPVALDVAAQVLSAITPAFTPPERVRVHSGEDGTSIAVLVGLSSEHSAVQVCRQLHDLIAADLNTQGITQPLTVSLTVSSVT